MATSQQQQQQRQQCDATCMLQCHVGSVCCDWRIFYCCNELYI